MSGACDKFKFDIDIECIVEIFSNMSDNDLNVIGFNEQKKDIQENHPYKKPKMYHTNITESLCNCLTCNKC